MSRSGEWRRERLARSFLYLCTPLDLRHDLVTFLDAVLAGGVDIVQLRDKHADADEIRAAAPLFRAAAERHGALFVLNDDPALAAEVAADGVHVGQDDMTPDDARSVVGADLLVGRSTHAVSEIDRALAEDCDYFAVGPVRPTPTKAGRPGVGLHPLRHAATVADRPWFVTGGMSPQTAGEALSAGARRLVVVRAVTEAADPAAVAQRMSALLKTRSSPAPPSP